MDSVIAETYREADFRADELISCEVGACANGVNACISASVGAALAVAMAVVTAACTAPHAALRTHVRLAWLHT
jgi:hypothetical protein